MEIIITPKALKQYKSIPQREQVKVKKKLHALEINAYEGKKLSGEFATVRSLRAWPYRILYTLDEEKQTIFVITIAHRQGVYH
jgi:addiction module RelE/StbE family toxin